MVMNLYEFIKRTGMGMFLRREKLSNHFESTYTAAETVTAATN